jgi:hypothetical protein
VCTSIPAQNEAAEKEQNEKPLKAESNFSILIRFHWGGNCSVLLVSSPEALRNYSTRAGGVSSDPAGDDVESTSVVGPSVYSSDVVSHSFIWGLSIGLAIQSNEWTEMQQQQDDAKRNQFGCALNQVDWPMGRTALSLALSLQLPCGDQSNLCRPGRKGRLQLDNSSAHLFRSARALLAGKSD